ncbi:MAG: hypothetical protein HOO96_23055, partial [Polyangiaceae bacterium]|nr:hypothetical protein [Polyangiaceae bacterium]
MACPSDDTFGRWLDGSLDDAAQRALLAHTETCDECRATAAQLQTLRSATLRSPSTPPSPAGSTALVGGKYRIDGAIGHGASAEVFAATDVQSGQQVALKMLHPNLRGDEACRSHDRRASAARDSRSPRSWWRWCFSCWGSLPAGSVDTTERG